MFAQRLKLARKKCGFAMQVLADEVGVSKQAISKYESGKMYPSDIQFMALVKALQVTPDFLIGGQVSELSSLEFRKKSNTKAAERAKAEAAVMESLENYLRVESILDLEDQNPDFGNAYAECVEDWNAIEEHADRLRIEWDLGSNPIPSVSELIEDHGVKLIECSLPEGIDGLSCYVKRTNGAEDIKVIVTSSNATVERKRFTLVHELAHLVINSAKDPIDDEKAMHRFSGAFLAPREDVIEKVGEQRSAISDGELFHLKRHYGISASAMFKRLKDLEILSETYCTNAYRSGRARAWRTEEPNPLSSDAVNEKPSRFKKLTFRAVAEQLLSPMEAARLWRASLEDFRREMGEV